jgi:hypothetical protein
MAAARALKSAKLGVPGGGYSYSQVEAALGQVLGADAARQARWLRGRIQHLRRLGFTPAAEGARVSYDLEWATRWLLALRLERVGLNPVDVVAFFTANWDRKPGAKLPVTSLREVIKKARAPIEKARETEADYHIDDVWLIVTFEDFSEFPKIGLIQPYRKPDNPRMFFDLSREKVVDGVVMPLTESLRALEAALKEATGGAP